jgi:nitronate monooxygenase
MRAKAGPPTRAKGKDAPIVRFSFPLCRTGARAPFAPPHSPRAGDGIFTPQKAIMPPGPPTRLERKPLCDLPIGLTSPDGVPPGLQLARPQGRIGFNMADFRIIQGGMGTGVSNWRLARAVARHGQLGVVSGTGLAILLARRLQHGDPCGHMRRALAAFPNPCIADAILRQFLRAERAGPPAPGIQYRLTPMPLVQSSRALLELTIAANFVEVFLAKEGHTGPVGINLLEKVQMPNLASLYGAMLAGVDYVLMGAGIPRAIPGVLDTLAAGQPAQLRIDVAPPTDPNVPPTAPETSFSRFNPADFFPQPPILTRPRFFAIVSSATLALTLARKSNGTVDGFVIELPVAGGHNAPPRGPLTLNDRGEPIYGPRDEPDLARIRNLNLPFFLAGGYASPQGLAHARAAGAQGIQVGTLFAFCDESGIDPDLKTQTCALALAGTARVLTDPLASPTGFPFKVLQMPATLSDPDVYIHRPRLCDVGYLRQAYRESDGTIGYRCAAEPVADYLRKGGAAADTAGRKCLCNGLFSTLGLGQTSDAGHTEPPILTTGDGVAHLPEVIHRANARSHSAGTSYSAADVLSYLLAPSPLPSPTPV